VVWKYAQIESEVFEPTDLSHCWLKHASAQSEMVVKAVSEKYVLVKALSGEVLKSTVLQ